MCQKKNEQSTSRNDIQKKKENIQQFKNEIINNFDVNDNKDIIESKDNFTFQMTTSENQKKIQIKAYHQLI